MKNKYLLISIFSILIIFIFYYIGKRIYIHYLWNNYENITQKQREWVEKQSTSTVIKDNLAGIPIENRSYKYNN